MGKADLSVCLGARRAGPSISETADLLGFLNICPAASPKSHWEALRVVVK